jgi:hypothetical protein
MDQYEYMRLPIAIIPEEIIEQYNLLPMVHKDYIYFEIWKGMCSFPQGGIRQQTPCQTMPCHPWLHPDPTHSRPLEAPFKAHGLLLCSQQLWRQKRWQATRKPLINVLEENYKAATDWDGALYCGVKLDWDYDERTVNLSMPGYVAAALHKFERPHPKQPCHLPSQWNIPTYGAKVQLTTPIESHPSHVGRTNQNSTTGNGHLPFLRQRG